MSSSSRDEITNASSPETTEQQEKNPYDSVQEILCLLLLNQASYETRILQLEEKCASLERMVTESMVIEEKREFPVKSALLPSSLTPFAPEYEVCIYKTKFRTSYTWCTNFDLYPRQYGVHHTDKYGNNVLTYSNDARLTEYALQEGANVHQVNKNGLSVMHFLYRVPNSLDLLCAAGGDINVRSSDGRTPIFLCKSVDMCEKLRQKGASLTTRDKNGNTLLHTAKSKALYQYYLGQGLYPVINKRGKLPIPPNK